MRLIETKISGCFEIQLNIFSDHRGQFIKTYHHGLFTENNLNTNWNEEYFSVSRKNVIRGMHFQLPPHDHEKLVYCTYGAVMDVIVDLRNSSSTFKKHITIELSAQKGNMLYIPKGCAHGFKSLIDNTVMLYKVATIYNPDADSGIAWDSCGIDWGLESAPIISSRDNLFIQLKDFNSKFI